MTLVKKIFGSTLRLLSDRRVPRASYVRQYPKIHTVPNRLMTTHALDEAQPLTKTQKKQSDLLLSEEDRNDFFRLKDLFSIEEMMEARVHLGHKEGILNPHMRPYIFGKRLGVLLFDLEHTARLLEQALKVTAEIAYRNGIILFVTRSKQNGYLVEDAAFECNEFSYCRRWDEKVFTDSYSLFGSVTRLPDLVIIFNTHEFDSSQHRAVTISAKMLIPTVAICDTNTNPTLVTYPVPGNDDSHESIKFYCKVFKTAIMKGKEKRIEILKKYGQELYNKTLEST